MANPSAVPADPLTAAHQRLLHEPGLQFDFSAAPALPQLPQWLMNFFKFLGRLQPLFQYLLWGALALVALTILYFVIREIVRHYRGLSPKASNAPEPAIGWRPPMARARALLAEADALAAGGKYGEAVHVLLFRSIEDINERKPKTVKPALTSRDIAALDDLPWSARRAFARIAASVEKNFFAGRIIDAQDFVECRKAYEAFAIPDAWSS